MNKRMTNSTLFIVSEAATAALERDDEIEWHIQSAYDRFMDARGSDLTEQQINDIRNNLAALGFALGVN